MLWLVSDRASCSEESASWEPYRLASLGFLAGKDARVVTYKHKGVNFAFTWTQSNTPISRYRHPECTANVHAWTCVEGGGVVTAKWNQVKTTPQMGSLCFVLELYIKDHYYITTTVGVRWVLKYTEWSSAPSHILEKPFPCLRSCDLLYVSDIQTVFLFGTCSIYFSHFQINLAFFPLELLTAVWAQCQTFLQQSKTWGQCLMEYGC